MKKKFYLFALLMVAVSSLVFDGCKKKDDDDPVDPRAKFLGTYNVTNSCLTGSYSCVITNSSQAGKVVISNMGNENWSATGTVTGSNMTLSGTATTTQCGTVTIAGSGTINGIVLVFSNVTYTFTQCNTTGPCTETFTKQ